MKTKLGTINDEPVLLINECGISHIELNDTRNIAVEKIELNDKDIYAWLNRKR